VFSGKFVMPSSISSEVGALERVCKIIVKPLWLGRERIVSFSEELGSGVDWIISFLHFFLFIFYSIQYISIIIQLLFFINSVTKIWVLTL
jgi:hypothetical protein